MTFFDTIRDEIKKEYNGSDIPKMDPKVNPLLDPKKQEPTEKRATSIDFLKDQATRYSQDKEEEKEPEPEPRPEPKPMFERPPQPNPEPPKPRPDSNDAMVALLREIRDQNKEILMVLRQLKDKDSGPRPMPGPTPGPSPSPERKFF